MQKAMTSHTFPKTNAGVRMLLIFPNGIRLQDEQDMEIEVL